MHANLHLQISCNVSPSFPQVLSFWVQKPVLGVFQVAQILSLGLEPCGGLYPLMVLNHIFRGSTWVGAGLPYLEGLILLSSAPGQGPDLSLIRPGVNNISSSRLFFREIIHYIYIYIYIYSSLHLNPVPLNSFLQQYPTHLSSYIGKLKISIGSVNLMPITTNFG